MKYMNMLGCVLAVCILIAVMIRVMNMSELTMDIFIMFENSGLSGYDIVYVIIDMTIAIIEP